MWEAVLCNGQNSPEIFSIFSFHLWLFRLTVFRGTWLSQVCVYALCLFLWHSGLSSFVLQYSLLVIFCEVISHEAFVFVWEDGTFFYVGWNGHRKGALFFLLTWISGEKQPGCKAFAVPSSSPGTDGVVLYPTSKGWEWSPPQLQCLCCSAEKRENIKSCIDILNEAETEWTLTFGADYQVDR